MTTSLAVEIFTTTEQAVEQYPDANSIMQLPSVSFEHSLHELCDGEYKRPAGWELIPEITQPNWVPLCHTATARWAVITWSTVRLAYRHTDKVGRWLKLRSRHISDSHVILPEVGASFEERLAAVNAMFNGALPSALARSMAGALQLRRVAEVWVLHSPTDKHFSILLVERQRSTTMEQAA